MGDRGGTRAFDPLLVMRRTIATVAVAIMVASLPMAAVARTDAIVPASGTRAAAEAVASTAPSTGDCPTGQVDHASIVVALIDDGIHGLEPWASDPPDGGMTLLGDLHPDGGSAPRFLGVAGRFAYLTADDGGHGRELWATDGTPAGTRRLTDGPAGVLGEKTSVLLGTLGEIALISLGREGVGVEVWRSDGTVAGTTRLATMPSGESHRVEPIGVAGDRVLFADRESVWVSDGTPGGTGPWTGPDLGEVVGSVNGRILMQVAAADGSGTQRLWASDGTPEGSVELAAVEVLDVLGSVGQRLILTADDGVHGSEPWATDGTPGGTVLLVDARPTGSGSIAAAPGPADGSATLAFITTDPDGTRDRWTTDGTPGGTKRVGTMPGRSSDRTWSIAEVVLPGTTVIIEQGGMSPQSLAGQPRSQVSNRLVAHPADGGRKRILRALAVPAPGFVHQALGAARGTAWFLAVEPFRRGQQAPDLRVWATDGTRRGTRSVLRIGSTFEMYWGDMIAAPELVTAFADAALYLADPVGRHLWRTDGTTDGTRVVADGAVIAMVTIPGIACQGTADGTTDPAPLLIDLDTDAAARPTGLTVLGDRVVFEAKVAGARALWQSDGTTAGTSPVPGPGDVGCDGEFCLYGLKQVLAVDGGLALIARNGLWWGDPVNGLEHVSRRIQGDASVARDRLYTIARDARHGWELWTMVQGEQPHLVRDIHPGPADGPCPATGGDFCLDQIATQGVLGGRLVFAAADGRHGIEPWVSDGTAAGTRMLRDIRPGAPSGGCPVVPGGYPCGSTRYVGARGQVFFWATDRAHGVELWRTNGTTGGTRLVADLRPGSMGSRGNEWFAVAVGARLFFAADDGRGSALWVSDGTANGTRRLRALAGGEAAIGAAVPFRDELLFVLDDGVHGSELWISDATRGGTRLVVDLAPGEASAGIAALSVAGGAAWFAATGSAEPVALWRTDGTRGGTMSVGGVWPEGLPTRACRRCDHGEPRDIVGADGRLFFTADDGAHGRELWVLPSIPGPNERLRPPAVVPAPAPTPSPTPGPEGDPSRPV